MENEIFSKHCFRKKLLSNTVRENTQNTSVSISYNAIAQNAQLRYRLRKLLLFASVSLGIICSLWWLKGGRSDRSEVLTYQFGSYMLLYWRWAYCMEGLRKEFSFSSSGLFCWILPVLLIFVCCSRSLRASFESYYRAVGCWRKSFCLPCRGGMAGGWLLSAVLLCSFSVSRQCWLSSLSSAETGVARRDWYSGPESNLISSLVRLDKWLNWQSSSKRWTCNSSSLRRLISLACLPRT